MIKNVYGNIQHILAILSLNFGKINRIKNKIIKMLNTGSDLPTMVKPCPYPYAIIK